VSLDSLTRGLYLASREAKNSLWPEAKRLLPVLLDSRGSYTPKSL